ncbi:MAG TPA: protein kinase [Kofleriaceae bacterium]|nr:protein kinase [Kofleriaceae bacterium]
MTLHDDKDLSDQAVEAIGEVVGRVIADKFRIRRCVGLGASGAVYQADQIALGRTVAVKLLRPELASDPKLLARFHDEALAASRLNHPNTVSIIDYGQTPDGLLYLVMEFLRGKTLTQLVRESFPLPVARIADIVGQVLAGLEEAHAAGVIHADLKADNIIVERRRGEWDLAKVLDFGVARIIGVTQKDASDKTICGTPEYMAPELIGGAEATVASDLYAVGVLLYELLLGVTPFGDSPRIIDILTRHIREAPAYPSERRPDLGIDSQLEELAMKALAKPPSERFASATDFRRAIEGARDQQRQRAEGQVACAGCGAVATKSFKFCPECGQPRGRSSVDVDVLELQPARRRASDPSAGGLFPMPFAGRSAELERLTDFMTGGTEACVLQLVSVPGVGRSRLVRAAISELASGLTVYAANSDPSGMGLPFYPIRAMVAAVLELPPVCTYELLHQTLEAAGLSQRDLPGIGELFGHEGELWQLEPPVRRRELLASTTRVLRAAGDSKRALLFFEDVDLYDNPSQELLRRLAESTGPDDALRIIVTNGPAFARLWDQRVVRVDLEPLESGAIEALHQHGAARGASLSTALELERVTNGSPAAIEQVFRYVLEGGHITSLPESLADLVGERLELLPLMALRVAQAAAVFGTEVYRPLLETALAPEVGVDALNEALDVLIGHGVLTEEASEDGQVIAFCQRLVREVVYDATPADVRRSLHASAATALEGMVADSATMGHHHELAGELGDAADLLGQGGDVAVHSFDDMGASRLYQRALACARRLMLGSDDDDNRIRFVTLSVKLAEALRVGGEFGLARGVVEEARGYCRDSPVLAAQLLRASAHLSLTEGNTTEAIDTVRRAIGQTIPTGRTELLCELYLDLSSMLLRDAHSSIASAELEEAIDLVTLGEGANADHGPPNLWRLLLRLAQLYAAMGQAERIVQYGEASLKHARRAGSRVGSARVQSMLAAHYERVGNVQRAERYRQAAVDEMRRLGDRRGTAELLLQGVRPTRTLMRISAESLHEARVLAQEVGWEEGVTRAARTVD